MSTIEITRFDDVIDSRDIIEKIARLESERDDHNSDTDNEIQWDIEYPSDAELLESLQSIADECSGYSEWEYGMTLIRGTYWEDYVEDECVQCGYIPEDLPNWIYIDWERTAEEFALDYSIVTFDDVDYYFRCC